MLRNYIKIAFRNLLRKKFFSALNIAGLAIGLACCTLIILYVADELSFDRFHAKAGRIYRIGTEAKLGDNELRVPQTPVPLAPAYAQEFPEIEAITRYQTQGRINVKVDGSIFSEKDACYVDSSFFSVFTFSMLEGDPEKSLTEPDGVVLTQEAAERYFGRSSGVLGSLLTVNGKPGRVTGILANLPANSTIKFSMLLPAAASEQILKNGYWTGLNLYTYMLLREGAHAEALEGKYPGIVRKYIGPQLQEGLGYSFDEFLSNGGKWNFYNEPLTDIHLQAGATGGELSSRMKTIYIFAAIALFILVLACINFMNLATARSADRAKEVGIRKVLGSVRKTLVGQFIAEAVLITGIAMLFSLLLTELSLPHFNRLADKALRTQHLFNPDAILMILLAVFTIGILSGSYPAFYLTSFKPVEVLKGRVHSGKGNWLRSSLVVFQFCISVTLIVCTLIVYNQLNYMQNRDLGFTKENVLVLRNGYSIGGKEHLFKAKLNAIPEVHSVSVANVLPALDYSSDAYRKLDGSNQEMIIVTAYADFDIVKTLGINLKEGRDFNPTLASDTNAILINEAAAIKLGYANPIGAEIDQFSEPRLKIIGIVENFHIESLRSGIEPLVIRPTFRG